MNRVREIDSTNVVPERMPVPDGIATPGASETIARHRFTLRDFLLVFFKFKRVVICTFLATVLGTLGWLWIRSDSYETSAKIVIKFTREAADPQTSLSPSITRVLPASKPDINTEAELIKSYALIDEVVTALRLDTQPEDLLPPGLLKRSKYYLKRAYHSVQDRAEEIQILAGLKEPLTRREKVIVQLIRGLKVETVKDSSVVKVTLALPLKTGAAEIVNTLVCIYRNRRMAVQVISGKTEFFDREAGEYKGRVREAEQRLQALKERFNISSMPEQTNLLLRNLSEADRLRRETSDTVRGAESKAALLRDQLRQLSPTVLTSQLDTRNTQLDQLSQRRAELQLERQRLSAKFDVKSVFIQDVDSQIQKVDQLIAETQATVQQSRTTSVNANYVDLEKELLVTLQNLTAAKSRLEGQERTVHDFQVQLETLRAAEISFNQLTREVMLNDETYRLHERNATEAKVSDALNLQGISSIAVVDPAVDPILASGIRKSYLVGGSVVLGLILALGLAFLFEGLDRSADSIEDVEDHLGRPLWGSISLIAPKDLRTHLLDDNDHEFASVASRLQRSMNGLSPQILVIRAASARAGATSVCIGIGCALRSLGTRTLLVDLENGPLLSGLGFHSKSSVQRLQLPNGERARLWEVSPELSVLACESGGQGWRSISENLQTCEPQLGSYNFVLVDVGFSLGERWRNYSGPRGTKVLVVAEWRGTRREVLDRIKEQARQEDVRISAGVLNKRQYDIPQFLYSRL